MKVVQTGKRYQIYDEVIVKDQFEPKSYVVKFAKMVGFYLEEYSEIKIREEKIYGEHMDKVNKSLNTFGLFNRNLGVILSGPKGMGKSLCATLLATEAMKNGLPLIIVDRYYPGIAAYLETIEQECMVMFDEFDKTFGDINPCDNEPDPQASMLSLFDGLSQGKKLFVITCNNIKSLNDYLVNRPGRFHYQFRFDYPSAEEITAYLKDKLEEEYYGEIPSVVSFSRKVDLNFDCLRSIAFEINQGEKFEEAIKDLNIVNLEQEKYTLALHFKDGEILRANECHMNLFGDNEESVWFRTSGGEWIVRASFNVADCIYDINHHTTIIKKEAFELDFKESDLPTDEVIVLKEKEVDFISVNKCRANKIHYMI